MTVGRVVGTVVSCAVVAGCAVVVVGMTRGTDPRSEPARSTAAAGPARTSRPAYLPRTDAASSSAPRLQVVSRPPTTASTTRSAAPVVPRGTVASTSAGPTTTAPLPAPRTSTTTTRPAARMTARPAPRPALRPAPQRAQRVVGQRLPLPYRTYTATRAITVTAGSYGSTRATLQAWRKVGPSRWVRYGAPVGAWVGSDGIGTASESRSKTPAGSFGVTLAFGRYGNPGTKLRYFRTTPSDYWMSSPGRLYNTHQRCGSCGYDNGVNERLYYVTPHYNYAAVIDYNRSPVRQGAGSAFFLHVSVGEPTAGCVAIPQSRLVPLLRWLNPAAHPRILIGVT